MGLLKTQSIDTKNLARDIESLKAHQEQVSKANQLFFAGKSLQEMKANVEQECAALKSEAQAILDRAKSREAEIDKSQKELDELKAKHQDMIESQQFHVKQAEALSASLSAKEASLKAKIEQAEQAADMALQAKAGYEEKVSDIKDALQKLV